jgi:hypothetical protein
VKKAFFLVISLILAGELNAQKIKYKDLFVFLSGRQYREAEPLLKKYLKENDDNPNAFMHMGYLYEAKFMAADVLKETNNVAVYGDSAAYYLDLANRNMTEKELKKNDEFYQEYARRNPRTGEFGVSLSDVVNHLTEKSKEIRDRQQKVVKLNRYFVQATGVYERLQKHFKTLTAPYENQKEFLLRSDDQLLEGLDDLSARQDSVVIAFNSYKSVLTQMGKSSYNQTIQTMEIKDFRKDGHAPADFYADKVMVWDYNYWAEESSETIKNEIRPLLGKLVLIDADLTTLRDKVTKDSVSVTQQISEIKTGLLSGKLLTYDPDPMPYVLLMTKISEINYGSEFAAGRTERRSEDLTLRLAARERELEALKNLDSISRAALERDIEAGEKDYPGFIRDTYGSVAVVQSYLKSIREYTENQKERTKLEIAGLRESVKWIVDGEDKIPAIPGAESSDFYPVFFQEEAYTTGLLHRSDTTDVLGYFYTITRDRKPQVKATFALDSTAFHYSKRTLMGGTVLNSVMGMVYYSVIWSQERNNGKVPVVISKIYTVDGLSWSNMFWIDGIPEDIKLIAQTGEINIKLTGADGPKVITITKDGKTL